MPKITIDQIHINTRKRQINPQKVSDLAESISLLGLMNPVTINQNNELLSGLHRIEAHRRFKRIWNPTVLKGMWGF